MIPVVYQGPGLLRGRRPQNIGEMRELHEKGVRTVVNLQGALWERDQVMEEFGWSSYKDLAVTCSPLGAVLPPSARDVREAVARIERSLRFGDVYVHCHDGVDRTGVVCAAWDVWRAGRSVEDAIRRMKAVGFHTGRYFWWLPFVRAMLA